MKVLVADVGNSSIKAAEFIKGEMVNSHRFTMESAFRDWVHKVKDVDHMVVGSVGQLDNIKDVSGGKFPVHLAKTTWDHELTVEYRSIETLGIDRLAGAVAAWDQFKSASLIFDLGSCLTIDFVNDHAVYHGGNISPGWGMRLRAMHQFTAKLPSVEMGIPDEILGKVTQEAMQNGAFRGLLYEMQGYIHELKQRNPQLNVILSGGDSFQFAKFLKMEIFVLPDLILKGLYKLLHANIQ